MVQAASSPDSASNVTSVSHTPVVSSAPDAKRDPGDNPTTIPAKPQDAEPGEESEQPQASASQAASPESDEKQDAESKPPAKPFYRRPLLMTVLVIAAIVVLVAVVAYWLYARQFEDTDDAFIDGHIVQVSPTKVSGYVDELLITDNQLVQAGDLLLIIDQRDYELAVDEAKAAEETAVGKLRQADAQVATAEAQAKAARADVAAVAATARNAGVDLARNRKLAPKGAVSMQSLDNSTATAKSSDAQLLASEQRADAAQAQYGLAKSERDTAAAQLAEARVQVRQADLNLSYTSIRAPITGRVTNRTVDKGNYVQPGQALFALVDPNVWVTANYKETQLTNMRVGQDAVVSVDAFPQYKLRAHIDSFQRGSGARFSLLPAENATGNYVKVVQRVPVKIVFDEPPPAEMILGPGMSVVPRVTVRGNQ